MAFHFIPNMLNGWGGITAHGRTPLVVVAGNLTGIRYWDEIVQPYVIPFIQAQANSVTFQQENVRPHVARVRQPSCTVSKQQNWMDCGTFWPDMFTKSIADCSRADRS
jgi:hypothetical protein